MIKGTSAVVPQKVTPVGEQTPAAAASANAPPARPSFESPPDPPRLPPLREAVTASRLASRSDADIKAKHARAKIDEVAIENRPPRPRVMDARRARFEQALYSVGWRTEGARKTEARVFERHDLRASPKIKVQGKHFWQDFAREMDRPYLMATQINVPGHAMLAIGNGSKGEFRFFDPNAGIFLFRSAEKMASFINRYCSALGETEPLSTTELRASLEVALPQGFGPPGSQLGEGICKALSLSVAQWFFENPNFSGPIDTFALGLKEFEPVESGLRSLEERAFKNAASSFLIALDLMSALQKLLLDEDGSIMRAEILARSPNKENWNTALSELQKMKLESPYVAAVMGLAFAKIEANQDFQQGLPQDWKGYQTDRVSIQELVPV